MKPLSIDVGGIDLQPVPGGILQIRGLDDELSEAHEIRPAAPEEQRWSWELYPAQTHDGHSIAADEHLDESDDELSQIPEAPLTAPEEQRWSWELYPAQNDDEYLDELDDELSQIHLWSSELHPAQTHNGHSIATDEHLHELDDELSQTQETPPAAPEEQPWSSELHPAQTHNGHSLATDEHLHELDDELSQTQEISPAAPERQPWSWLLHLAQARDGNKARFTGRLLVLNRARKQLERLIDPSIIATTAAFTALVIWCVALPFVDVDQISGWGLLTGLPIFWYLAYAVAFLALLIAASTRAPRLRIVALASMTFLIVLFATTSATYGAPRYSWTYKHIGVTEYLMAHGSPARDVDIYQNFPGFFYVIGIIHSVTQIPVMLMAEYSEVVFSALTAVAIYWTLGSLTASRHVRLFTTLAFVLTNWLGQTYFAPQSAALPLSIVLVGIFLRAVASGQGRPRSTRLTEQLVGGRPLWTRPSGIIITVGLYTFVVVTHQFTPAALLIQIAALTVLFRLRRPWLCFTYGVIFLLWLVQAYPYLSRHFSLFDVSGYENIRPPAALDPVLAGTNVMAEVPHIITLFVAIATIAGGIRTIVRTRSVVTLLIPGVLALAPVAIVIVQPYGQEGILRCYLFSLPWCCFVIVRDLFMVDLMAARRRILAVITPVFISLGVLAVPANLGNEMINHIYPADVAASQWFEKNTPPGSELLLVVPAHPTRTTQWYDLHVLLEDPLSPSLLREVPGFDSSTATGKGLVAFTRTYVESRSAGHDVYLAIGPTQRAYMKLYGLVTQKTFDDYITDLEHDPNFRLVYERNGSYIFETF